MKTVSIMVKPNSKKEDVYWDSDQSVYVVRVNKPAIEGQANKRVIELLAQFYNIAKSKIVLYKGSKSKIKIFKIKID